MGGTGCRPGELTRLRWSDVDLDAARIWLGKTKAGKRDPRSKTGVIISPPVPAFYNQPKTVEDIVDHTVTRMLDLFGLHTDATPRWDGEMRAARA